MANRTAPLLQLYHERKCLSKLGITQDVSEISAWEAQAYVTIENKINELEQKETKRGSRR